MNISEAAKKVQLPVKTVRYYADIGLVEPTAISSVGYRQYDEKALKKLTFIRRAREFGFSINECRELMGLYQDKNRSSIDVKIIASKRLEEIKQKQQELQSLHDELAHIVDCCHGDNRPDCPIIDSLVLEPNT